jgi:hypothetical protein
VLHQVTHFIPWEFPLLIVVPAAVVDWLLSRTASQRARVRAPIAGLAFLAALVAAQWPFAQFLMTPLARNWFFGTAYLDYGTPPDSDYARYVFHASETPPQFWRGMLLAAVISCVMMYIGLHAGRAMQRVKR